MAHSAGQFPKFREPSPQIIETLKAFLKRAEDGELQSLCIAGELLTGDIISSIAIGKYGTLPRLAGASSLLNHRVLTKFEAR